MIDVKELRIGNWVGCDEDIYIVNGIWNEGVVCLTMKDNDPHNIHPSNLQPIPLTSEILEKCGFVKEFNGTQDIYTLQSGLLTYSIATTQIKDKEMSLWCDNAFAGCIDIKVQFLHDLQNIIYSTSKTELNIQL